jgi:hypothetical protein
MTAFDGSSLEENAVIIGHLSPKSIFKEQEDQL